MTKHLYSMMFMVLCYSGVAQTVDSTKKQVTVFIDCNTDCDMRYIKTEINYIDFAPDRFLANVYIMLTSQQTGAGGKVLTLFISGQKDFAGMEDTLTFFRNSINTDDEYRKMLVLYLKLGLTRFISKTPIASRLSITAASDKQGEAINSLTNKKDRWNFWVFNIGLNGDLDSDDFSKNLRFGGNFNASRVTEKLKLNLNLSSSKNERKIIYQGEKSTFLNDHSNFSGTVVRSIGKHWGVGGFLYANQSTYSNYDFELNVYPAVEFSIFPYKDAVKKTITILYQAGRGYKNFIDTSYYGMLSQWTTKQDISLNIGILQKWGNIYGYISYESYLNAFTLGTNKLKGTNINNLSFGGNLEFRVIKGLFFEFSAYANLTKGIYPNIAKKSFSRDDLLTNTQQYPTQKRVNVDFGINYRFGSIYNNVVNPRFTGRR